MPVRPTLPKGLIDQLPAGRRPKKAPTRKEVRKADRAQKKRPTQPPYKPSTAARPEKPKTLQISHAEKPPPRETSKKERLQPAPSAVKPQQAKARKPKQPSRQVQDALDKDDAEIARLEKKLGIRGKKRKVQDVDDLLDGFDEPDPKSASQSLDAEASAWLQQKRRRVESLEDLHKDHDGQSESGSENIDDSDDYENDDYDGHDNGHAHDSEEDGSHPDSEIFEAQPRVRENPYRPPETATLYIPPSLRVQTPQAQDSRLRRQVQGQVNRLSEANMLSIVGAVEEIYRTNPRQHVTSSLVDILLGIVSDPSPLNDQFIILHAGFVAAVFRTRPEFGALVIERLATYTGKQSNLMAFLAELYNLDVIGCPLVYDYIRQLMADLTESSTEVLLRVIRHCGPRLRQDDPSALKEIVANAGTSTSVRHKFLLESLSDLQTKRAKPAALTEHVTRVKKTLGTLKTRQEPLRMTLSDLANTDKRGKWWQVGGVVHDIQHTAAPTASSAADSVDSLSRLAKAQGMNTDVRRAIFVTLMSSADYKDAHTRLLKLGLKKAQAHEIPRVLVHCVCAEATYNRFYTLVATQFMDKRSATTLHFCFYDFLKRVDDATTREMFNMARMYAALYDQGLRFLHKIDWAYLSPHTASFLEVLVTSCTIKEDTPGLKYFMQSIKAA